MPTVNQLIRRRRKRAPNKTKTPALRTSPQKRGVVQRVTVIKPRKPNSAQRPTARVRLTNGTEVTAYIPGEGLARHIQEHSVVLVRGGRRPDLPGVRYQIIPGGAKFIPGAEGWRDNRRPFRRNKARSKYGVTKP